MRPSSRSGGEPDSTNGRKRPQSCVTGGAALFSRDRHPPPRVPFSWAMARFAADPLEIPRTGRRRQEEAAGAVPRDVAADAVGVRVVPLLLQRLEGMEMGLFLPRGEILRVALGTGVLPEVISLRRRRFLRN